MNQITDWPDDIKTDLEPIDLVAPLKALKHRAEGLHESEFRDGYLMALQHAIELAEVQQIRLAARSLGGGL